MGSSSSIKKGSVSSVLTEDDPMERRMIKPAPSRCDRAVNDLIEAREGI